MISFGSKLNRSFGMYLPFQGDYIDIDIFFHKSNTFLGFNTGSKINHMCRDGNSVTTIYRDLSQSSFAMTFLDIRNVKSRGLDIRNQFSNILQSHQDKIQYVGNETIKLYKIQNPKNPDKPFESNLFVYTFTFSDYQDDFLYILAERHHPDTIVGKKLVRTSSLQISTRDCLDQLRAMVANLGGTCENSPAKTRSRVRNIHEQDNHTDHDLASDLRDMFPDKITQEVE